MFLLVSVVLLVNIGIAQKTAQSYSAKYVPWLPFTIGNKGVPDPNYNPAAVKHQMLYASTLHTDTTTFSVYPANLAGVICGDAVWIDYDNDGQLDLLVSGRNDSVPVTKIYHNDHGVFTDIGVNIPGIVTEHGVAWGDFDNDGDYDLAIEGNLQMDSAHAIPITRIYRNDNGVFTDIHAPLMQLMGGSVTWIDYDNDGKLDLLVSGAHVYGSQFYTKLYHNDGAGNFSEVPIYLPGVWASSIVWSDYDNDGMPDLLITGYGDWGVTTALFHNDCHADTVTQFTQVSTPLQALNSCGVAWGDYDNDGYLDLAFSGDPPTWTWNTFATVYHNNGDGTFTDINPGLQPVSASAIAWGDYDNDGLPDLALSGWVDDTTNVTRIYHNDGGGVFHDIGANLPGTWFGSLAWGDFDNDGKLDLVITGGTTPQLYYNGSPPYGPVTLIYHNNLIIAPNHPPLTPSVSAKVGNGGAVQLSWDKTTDDHTPQRALTYNLRLGTSPGADNLIPAGSNTATGFRRAPKAGNSGYLSARNLSLPVGTYYWSVQAVDNGYAGSTFAAEQKLIVQPPPPPAHWYLISVSHTFPDQSRTTMYPDARSEAFAYNGGYVIKDSLEVGVGYWLKFPSVPQEPTTFAVNVTSTTIPLHVGWNLIGSISTPVAVSALISQEGEMTLSSFFGYNGSYYVTDSILPGKGYWVKSNTEGTLYLSSSAASKGYAIHIVPGEDRPPVPPSDDGGYVILAPPKRMPTSYALSQNYPNPFNPTTRFEYALPTASHVSLKIYNVLGQEIATVVDGYQSGYQTVYFDASKLSSGLYFYRLSAGKFTDTKKMMVIK